MSTRSSKSTGNKKTGTPNHETRSATSVGVEPVDNVPERIWLLAVIGILIIAAVLRAYDLNLVPFHHDEGVNGNFLVRLVREGEYKYDPDNYHGPTLYYFAALIPWTVKLLFGTVASETYGLNDVTVRFVTALFGLGTVGLIFPLRRRLGTIATLVAALLLAVSPGAVYLSRYFIHETLFGFFTLGIVVAGLRYYELRNPTYLLLATGSAALLFATKETAFISVAVLAIAFGSTHVYLRLVGKRSSGKHAKRGGRPIVKTSANQQFIEDLGGPTTVAVWAALTLLLFIAINVFFYSSFFKNYPKGVYDSLNTFKTWTKTGGKDHVKPFLTYIHWLWQQETPLLVLGSIGAGFTVLKPRRSVALFTALWAFGLIAAYSLIPYKTPWLILSFLPPLALISGYALQTIYEVDRQQLRLPVLILVVAVTLSVYKSIDLNFFNYDNDAASYVYVYAHTKRDILDLVREVDRVAKQGEGDKTGITIMSADYWPLPWYFRQYSRVGYYKGITPTIEPLIIASESQKEEVEATFGELYKEVPSGKTGGGFELRPGVKLLLYARRPGFRRP